MDFPLDSNAVNRTPIEAPPPKIKVIGLGGGGCNAINRMIEYGMEGVDFIGCNTDKQALTSCLAPTRIQLGPKCTKGLGAGGMPSVGETAAEESFETLAEALEGADMVFLAAGMGGGTGTGSIPVAARVAKAIGAVTIAVVTTPFSFEMGRRQKNAVLGLAKLRKNTDTLITVPNDRLLEVAPLDLPLEMAFKLADDVLRQGVQGIAELITETGLINVDFAHIRHVMSLGGGALMAIGHGQGEQKAPEALGQALHHPLLEEVCLESATGIIANFTGGTDLTFSEVAETLSALHQATSGAAEIIPGVINDPRMDNRCQAILIVTGLGALPIEKAIPGAERILQAAAQEQEQKKKEEKRVPVYAGVARENRTRPQSQPLYTYSESQQGLTPADLDIPAFLRKRVKG
jgi:cell division protein FtsZ